MIVLPTDAAMLGAFECFMRKKGKGVLYVHSKGLTFERKEGLVWECTFDDLFSATTGRRDTVKVTFRTGQGTGLAEFKVKNPFLVEGMISENRKVIENKEIAKNSETTKNREIAENREIAKNDSITENEGMSEEEERKIWKMFDQKAHSQSEARWFESNWDEIMKFVKPEQAAYLSNLVRNLRVDAPHKDPYVLVVDFENLTLNDFADLPGFLRWRYGDITEKEVRMVVDVFKQSDMYSVRTFEMVLKMCRPLEPKFRKDGYSLYEFTAIVSEEKLQSLREREKARG